MDFLKRAAANPAGVLPEAIAGAGELLHDARDVGRQGLAYGDAALEIGGGLVNTGVDQAERAASRATSRVFEGANEAFGWIAD